MEASFRAQAVTMKLGHSVRVYGYEADSVEYKLRDLFLITRIRQLVPTVPNMSLQDSAREIWISLEKHSWKGISSWSENSAQFENLIDTVSGYLNRTTAFKDPVIQLGSHTGSKRVEIVVRIQEYLRSVNHDKDFDNLNMLLLERKSSKETQRLIELLNVRLIDIFFNMQNGIADVYKKILLACGYDMNTELKLADSLKQFKKRIQAADFKSKLSLQYSLQTITGQDKEHTVCQSWFITSDETMIIEKHTSAAELVQGAAAARQKLDDMAARVHAAAAHTHTGTAARRGCVCFFPSL